MRATEGSVASRACSVAVLGLFALVLMPVSEAPALEAGLPRLLLEVPSELRVGQHAHVNMMLELPPEAAEPLLLTPYHEGEAVEVVKGRLLRSDARDPHANPLRFELPLLASAPGTALIGARVLAYLCTARCRAVEIETSVKVVVLPR